jgi:hypothetical protein
VKWTIWLNTACYGLIAARDRCRQIVLDGIVGRVDSVFMRCIALAYQRSGKTSVRDRGRLQRSLGLVGKPRRFLAACGSSRDESHRH